MSEELSDWSILYEEHAWSGEGHHGFIDLAIEWTHRTWVMNIECKRVRDAEWIFLKDRKAPSGRRQAKLWISYYSGNGDFTKFDWADVAMDPLCPESSMCVVPGQDQKATPMLERVSSGLVMSTEALAREEASFLKDKYSGLRMYQNVIVTTARLKLCEIDLANIDIASGEIDQSASSAEVPFVRFRKQLGTASAKRDVSCDTYQLRDVAKEFEDTVFVVNSARFAEFVRACEVDIGPLMAVCGRR
ncbi:hypothetical protein K8B33_09145 [Alcanivorax sp. JB21]|uniref:hypothetical protein n=1 Tax=Alcanivorax limicola TaxID=2874102 RepID=UPI001CBC840E|nr:hypothetical protein [Alcanivorax limicola]MBZ2189261.1 hypothetical protein [Alcanivorax limicola]